MAGVGIGRKLARVSSFCCAPWCWVVMGYLCGVCGCNALLVVVLLLGFVVICAFDSGIVL